MPFRPARSLLLFLLAWWPAAGLSHLAAAPLEPIPERLVVLTFDDAVKSHHTVARPLLKKYGFGASFFVTEGFTFATNKKDYMTWEEIRELHDDGFEIGNHTRDHLAVTEENLARLEEQLSGIDEKCRAHGIPRPTSFAWPGNAIAQGALEILRRHGIRFARRGGAPEHPYERGRGFAYEPGLDHPLLIPSAGDARPSWKLEDFKTAVEQARDGRIAVLQFHGVPEGEHPWVDTPRERFQEFLEHLHAGGYKVIALRDLERYVDPGRLPQDPWEIVRLRRDLVELSAACEPGSALTLYDLVGRGNRGTRGHWGFSSYLRFGGRTILFDTGNDPSFGEGEPPASDGPPFFASNAGRLGARLDLVDLAIISHRHRDHAGGLKQFRAANPKAAVHVPDPALLEEYPEARLELELRSRELLPGHWLIRTESRELELPELSLGLDTPRGLVLVTGCCHPGVETIVKEARQLTGRPIHLLYGGFHLFPSPPEEVEALGRRLLEEHGVERVAPAHCSGWPEGGRTDTEAIFRKLWGPERFRYGRLEARLYFPGPARRP
jgi:metal-dependent hydrolase (beta-lactamase superfamily II)/peptidoglycan/xylan/chitin deacetylase (PgdA/CDA1 family)